jgi:hypothetical protein
LLLSMFCCEFHMNCLIDAVILNVSLLVVVNSLPKG